MVLVEGTQDNTLAAKLHSRNDGFNHGGLQLDNGAPKDRRQRPQDLSKAAEGIVESGCEANFVEVQPLLLAQAGATMVIPNLQHVCMR